MRAGQLRERFRFEKRNLAEEPGDGYGNLVEGWIYQFSAWGGLTPLRRGETVIAARLSGVQPYVLAMRASSDTRRVTTEWRVQHISTGRFYNIKTVEPSADHASIDCLLEEATGAADG